MKWQTKHLIPALAGLMMVVGCGSSSKVETEPVRPAVKTVAKDSRFQLPSYTRVQLDNGLTLMLMEQHEVPLIAVNTRLDGGALADHGRAGLARMTAQSLLFGTDGMTRSELENQLDFIGAQVNSSAGKEFNTLSASFATADRELMLPLLADILLRPAFDGAEFDRYKQRRLSELMQQKESPRGVIGKYFDKLVFGNHPYAAVADGYTSSVEAITVDEVRDFHDRWYTPAGAVISVVGDFETAAMQQQLTELFGGWTGGPAEAVRMPVVMAPTESRVLLVDKGDARETTFYIGGPGVARSNPDYVAIHVINTILGGRFTSWLNDELRVNAGLTYGARSRFDFYRRGGAFRITTYTATASTVEAVDLALDTYARLWQQGVDETILASAKAYVKGQFPPDYETSGQLANLLSQMHAYGFDERFIDDFEQKVDALTVTEARRIIAEYFPQENLQFVMVGKADEIRDLVAQYGEVIEVDIMQDGFDF